jgi:hypothetical protein
MNAKFVRDSLNELQSFEKKRDPLGALNIGQSYFRKDKNGRSIKIGDNVLSPEPTGDDMHQYDFFGTDDSFRDEMVVVVDQEDDYYEVESEKLEVVNENGQ